MPADIIESPTKRARVEEKEEQREPECTAVERVTMTLAPWPARRVRVIAFSGGAGCGKDYLSENVVIPWFIRTCRAHVRVVALADELKKICNARHGVSFERMFINKDTESRQLLQRVGVEEREQVGADVWIKKLDFQIQIDLFRKIDFVIVTDLRFQNELAYFRARRDAVCIRIEAPQRNLDKVRQETKGDESKMKAILEHISERDLDNADFDFRLKNDYADEATSSTQLIEYLETLVR